MPSRQNKYYRRRRAIPAWVAIALIVVALALGVGVGYLARTRGQTGGPQPEAGETVEPTPVPEDEDGLPVEPIGEAEAAGLLSGDIDIAPLAESAGDASQTAADELLSAPSEPEVVAEYEGGEVLSSEVIDAYNEIVDGYLLNGFSVSDNAADLLEETLRSVVSRHIALQKAEELGLNELSAADETALAAEAEAEFSALVEELLPEFADGERSDEEARAAAAALLSEDEGITEESIAAQLREDLWTRKLFDSVTADIELTEEGLQDAYDTLVAAQRDAYDGFTDDYEYARLNGELIVYNPQGYRAVRHILLAFDAEALDAGLALAEERDGLDAEADAARIAEIDKALDELYAPLEARAQAARERLEAGEDFEALLQELGEDDYMLEEDACYYVGANTVLWSDEFVAAALALPGVGDVSEPVRSLSGVHLIRFAQEVPAGEVPLADVRGELEAWALDDLRQAAYDAQMDTWLEEADVTYYPERMQ